MADMRASTVRLSHRMHRMVIAAAKDEGITVAQFIREAVLVRLAYIRVTEHPTESAAIEQALREIREETL